ncbi:hypothetical protein QBC39DRAFT_160595 [Podospora conica]|nr:hypothetical protein QBC39DRAFT_160595 [Schizothecium conicum]
MRRLPWGTHELTQFPCPTVCPVGVRKTVGDVDGAESQTDRQTGLGEEDAPGCDPWSVLQGSVMTGLAFRVDTAIFTRIQYPSLNFSASLRLQSYSACASKQLVPAPWMSLSFHRCCREVDPHRASNFHHLPCRPVSKGCPVYPFRADGQGIYLVPPAPRITASGPPTRNSGLGGKSSCRFLMLESRDHLECFKNLSHTHQPCL